MDNQHRAIRGYRELSQAEIDLMNDIKECAAQVGSMVERLRAMNGLPQGAPALDQRWVSIGATDLQRGFMALTRAVAKPTFF